MTKYFTGNPFVLDQTRVYMQFVCDFEDLKKTNQLKGLYISLTSIVSCFFYSYVIYYKRVSSEIEEKQWDLSTVTTADFTVDIEIPKEVWPKWKEYKHELHVKNNKEGIHKHLPSF